MPTDSHIYRRLSNLLFSTVADLSKLTTDWPRTGTIPIYINGIPLKLLLGDLDPETLVASSDKVEGVLSLLIPEDIQKSSLLYNNMAKYLHQGALPLRLIMEVTKVLKDHLLIMDNKSTLLHSRIDIERTPTGFSVKELFAYTGNISAHDPTNPLFTYCTGDPPLLSGKCVHNVEIAANGSLTVHFQEMELSSPVESLTTLLLDNSSQQDLEEEAQHTHDYRILMLELRQEYFDSPTCSDVEGEEVEDTDQPNPGNNSCS
jgi:hypothetical protein